MNLKQFNQNFKIGENSFVARHPNSSVIYFLLDKQGEIIYVGETEERRWSDRRSEHYKSGKVFQRMVLYPTGVFKKDALKIEKGLILMLKPILNKEKPSWKKEYLDGATNFINGIGENCDRHIVETKVEYVEREVIKEVVREVQVIEECEKKYNSFQLTAEHMFYKTASRYFLVTILVTIIFACFFIPYLCYNSNTDAIFMFSIFAFLVFLFSLKGVRWMHQLGYNFLPSYRYFKERTDLSNNMWLDFLKARLCLPRQLNNEDITELVDVLETERLKRKYRID